MDEKRGFMRFRVSFPLKFIQDEISAVVKGIVKDISMSGLKVVLDQARQFLSQDLSNFHLRLDGDKLLKLSGQIVWQKDYPDRREVGIQFVCIPDSNKEDIYDYIFKYHRQELTQQWWQM